MLTKLKTFACDRSGASTVLLALSLPVILMGVGGSIDMTRAMAMRQNIANVTELACTQATKDVNDQSSKGNGAEKANYKPYVDQLITRRISEAGLTGVTGSSTVSSQTISITTTGQSQNIFASFLNFNAVTVSAVRNCPRTLPTPPSTPGQIMFLESFEQNHNVPSNSWTVLRNWNGWTTRDAGIEINGMPQLSGNVIRFGNFFAELDSHCYVSGCNSNSTMSREVELTRGPYELRYWYISRVRTNQTAYANRVGCGTESEVAWAKPFEQETNRIEVFVEREGNYNFEASKMVDLCVYSDTWVERKISINITRDDTYRISWRAAGKQDTVGGLIDYIRFCTRTCP